MRKYSKFASAVLVYLADDHGNVKGESDAFPSHQQNNPLKGCVGCPFTSKLSQTLAFVHLHMASG